MLQINVVTATMISLMLMRGRVSAGPTCVAVVRVEGLKVNSPCSSSSRSSPAALKMCSRGVPGNSLNAT